MRGCSLTNQQRNIMTPKKKPSIVLEKKYTDVFGHSSFRTLITDHYQELKRHESNSQSGRLWDERNYMLDLLATMSSSSQKRLDFSDSKMSIDGMLQLVRLIRKIIETEKIPEAAELTALAETRGEKLMAQWLTEQWPPLLRDVKASAKRIKKLRWELMKAPPDWHLVE